MSIPAHFQQSDRHRALYGTMRFLERHDPVGPVVKGLDLVDREVRKAAVDRRRTLLEHRAADRFAEYFREERHHVAEAVGAGRSVNAALRALEPDLRETLEGVDRRSADQWGQWVARHLGRTVKAKEERAYDFGAPIDEWLARNAGKKITGITEATRKEIAQQLAIGRDKGETLAQLKKRIDQFYLEDIVPNRSMLIARTEVGSATNWMQHWIAQDTDVPMEREWFSLHDSRVRDDHAEADGQRVGMDEPFLVGGDELMYPGDPSGDPEQIINCRCSVTYHVIEGKMASVAPPEPPSPAEFAKDVLGVESPDVITALAFAKGVFGQGDEWVRSREILMKHVYRLRRAAS